MATMSEDADHGSTIRIFKGDPDRKVFVETLAGRSENWAGLQGVPLEFADGPLGRGIDESKPLPSENGR